MLYETVQPKATLLLVACIYITVCNPQTGCVCTPVHWFLKLPDEQVSTVSPARHTRDDATMAFVL